MDIEKFNQWNWVKQKIHFQNKKYFDISEWQIWFVSMWNNIWFEEDWKWKNFLRPVLVIKKTWNMIFSISLTSQEKNNEFHFQIKKWSFAILSQTKHLDKKRFQFKIWKAWSLKFKELKEKLKKFLL